MKKSVFEKRKHIPRWLVPGCKKGRIPGLIKRHAATVFESVDDQWRLFAEGCLRNRYFHEEVFLRGSKCLGCDRQFNRAEALVSSKIEKHHNDYLRLCTGYRAFRLDRDLDRDAWIRDPLKAIFLVMILFFAEGGAAGAMMVIRIAVFIVNIMPLKSARITKGFEF